jgi:hypothetical protein
MKEKALILIGLHSKKWLAEKMGINSITLEKRLKTNYWKLSEMSILEDIFNQEKINL